MRIFFNTYPVAFQCPGGGEIQLLKSKEALEKRGHEVVLFDQWKHSLRDADVVHQFSVQGGIYNFCQYVQNSGIPLVVSPILWLSEYVDQYPMGEIGHLLNLADVICPNSEAESIRFVKHFEFTKPKYMVTHNGVDDFFFDRIDGDLFRTKFDINGEFALCVGNIETRKNQLALVEAAAEVNLPVVLIGDIRDELYFKQIEQSYFGKFNHIGVLQHNDPLLRSAYSACSVFALPSLLETPGLAALEAAASNAPILITSEGCTAEYFQDSVYYVNPKSIGEIAAQLSLAIKEQKRPEDGFVKKFSWDQTALELEMAYKRAIASKS